MKYNIPHDKYSLKVCLQMLRESIKPDFAYTDDAGINQVNLQRTDLSFEFMMNYIIPTIIANLDFLPLYKVEQDLYANYQPITS